MKTTPVQKEGGKSGQIIIFCTFEKAQKSPIRFTTNKRRPLRIPSRHGRMSEFQNSIEYLETFGNFLYSINTPFGFFAICPL